MSNLLAHETSPYLLQHADNPVDWMPWSTEAFALANKLDKPVLLSIGYSACHWCHVMAHESFEDEGTAALMNKLFVNIKVDREERPDVDKIYQTAHQLLTQRGGGWPLTMFLDPSNQRPFYGGTYFPREARYGMPAFGELVQSVAKYFAEHRDEVRAQGEQLQSVFAKLDPAPAGKTRVLGADPLKLAAASFARSFDRDYGGFGDAPKFPHPTTIDRLLRDWRASANDAEPDLESLFMATLSLKRMADGGLYDHLGGGFCRYSVDRFWRIPHFEKMLYDNGPLLALYAQAWLATGDAEFAAVANGTADWMLADMRAPDGGFYATRDADSEGVEGKYYVWTPGEVEALLSKEAFAVFSQRFGLDQPANFEGEWHLHASAAVADIASKLELSEQEVTTSLERSRQSLLAVRGQRIPPGRDEKQLTAWNALAIRGLAIAGRALGRDDLIDAAADAVRFIHERLYANGRLQAVYKDGRARFAGYLDDYAFLLDALLELLQARWSGTQLAFAVQLADSLLLHFEDTDGGGFWFTADDHEALMHRPKPYADEAVPSGNGKAAFALQRLGFLLGEPRYLAAAEATLRSAWSAIEEFPHAHVSLLNALDEYLAPPEIVVIRGPLDEITEWRDATAKLYAPRRLVFAIEADCPGLPGALAEREAIAGQTIAYRCSGSQCGLPVTSWPELATQISGI
ncbi:MAG TPA: thioredoxin domain-containing protein [Woeseiaceae bacterium]|nr:thioredoxin domain-containing protein [Woeseiaceae bacterium]